MRSGLARVCRMALNWLSGQFRRNPWPIWLVVTSHVVVLGVALLIYALPHHVIPHSEVSIGLASSRVSSSVQAGAPAQSGEGAEASTQQTDEQDAEPLPEPTPEVGDFRASLAGHFTDGEVTYDDTSYRSANLDLKLYTEFNDDINAQVYMVDIYIADISCLMTAFGQDTYGRGYTEWVENVARRYDAVLTINGDYYGTRDTGVVIRNGTLYRDNKTTNDLAVLYWDGHMEMFGPDGFDARREIERGACRLELKILHLPLPPSSR